MKYKKRKCPSCGDDSSDHVEVRTDLSPESLPLNDVAHYWNGFFKDKMIFPYARCSECSLLYAPTYFDEKQLEELYRQMPANMDLIPKESLEKTQNGYYEIAKKLLNDNGDYLELGADIGLFTINCIENNKFGKYWLVEPNVAVHEDLKVLTSTKSASIISDMDDLDGIPDGTISFAVLVHVLDHLIDPVSTLQNIRRKLTKDAHVLIVTHDESSFLRRVVGKGWPAFCLQHPQLFNKKTLATMLETAGLKAAKQVTTKNEFPISFLLKQFLWALGLRIQEIPSFLGITVNLGLGNILTLARMDNLRQ